MKSNKKINPPTWARRFFEWYCSDETVAEDLTGDMEELFHHNLRTTSAFKARLKYCLQILVLIFSYAVRNRKRRYSLRYGSGGFHSFAMYKSYTTLAFRNLARQKVFSFINMICLSVGMSVGLLALAVFIDVMEVDNFQKEAKNIYRVTTEVDNKDFKLIGTAVRNVDNQEMITGKPLYGLDFYREGMLHAMIQRPQGFGMKLKSVDAASAKAMPGIVDVVTFKNNVAVVGKSTWQVLKARKLLKIEYEKEGNIESSADHDRLFKELLDSKDATVRRKDGDVEAAFKSAAKVITSEYQCPFLSHSPMEPMNFFAHVRPDGVELVGPTQTPDMARNETAKLLGIAPDQITLSLTRLGGGFGRRLKADYVVEAAELSSLIKAPVKVTWTREDDMTGGSYRPAVRYRFQAALDEKGNMIGYKLRGVGINSGNCTREDNFPSGAVDHLLIDSVEHKSPITTGAWRAPITNFLAFAEQSFLDEVALAANQDPISFRLKLLEKAKASPVGAVKYDIGRMQAVIQLAAEKSGWGTKKNLAQGFSVYFSHRSYVAQVAEVEMKKGKPILQKIYACADCGVVVNLSGAYQQVRGGVVDGLGHAMFSKLSFKDGAAEQKNFNSYRLIRLKEVPEIDVHFINNGIDPTGLGEPALPPTGGAVANAIFKATGKRLRNQPFALQEEMKNVSFGERM